VKEIVFTRRFEGEFAGFTECHVDADWLLIYRVLRHRVVLYRTGTHRELFRARRGN